MDKEKDKERRKRYQAKTLQFAVKYGLSDIEEGKRLKEYLELTGQSGNSYIKKLIKRDLDARGV